MPLVRSIINDVDVETGIVLEVGCGDGFLLHELLKKKPKLKCFGVDLSRERLKRTRESTGVPVVEAEISNLPVPNNCFDLVICSEVLEHVKNWKRDLEEIVRVCKPSKEVIVTVPYNEELRKVLCPNCRKWHYIDGHINSFVEEDFEKALSESSIASFYTKRIVCPIIFNKYLSVPEKLKYHIDPIFAQKFGGRYLLVRIIKHDN